MTPVDCWMWHVVGCHHSIGRSPIGEDLPGGTIVRVVAYLDVGGRCPRCATSPRPRGGRRS